MDGDVEKQPAAQGMRAVILAAGDGGRLGAHTAALPKPLVLLNGRPLIDYTLRSLADAGVREVVVVTGYREKQVMAALSDGVDPRVAIRFVSNPRFRAGASLSLRAARRAMGEERFLLAMSDHLLSAPLVQRLLADGDIAEPGISLVAADAGAAHSPEYVDEATRLGIDAEGFVTEIGKGLRGWRALDAGAFSLSPTVWEAVDAVAEDCELSVIFAELARRKRLRTADITGSFWYDVDTADDLAAAGELLANPNGSACGV